jgi:hypothetical protein
VGMNPGRPRRVVIARESGVTASFSTRSIYRRGGRPFEVVEHLGDVFPMAVLGLRAL